VDLNLWLAVAVLSFQGGSFLAFVVTEYYHHDHQRSQPRVAVAYALLELLCLGKFLLVTWCVILDPSTTNTPDANKRSGSPGKVTTTTSMTTTKDMLNSSSSATIRESDYKLQSCSLIMAYAFGYCVEVMGIMVSSR
jgi:uncharacterized transporter YbjL